MTHGALFNGIAGFPLAASWAGIPTTWMVEIDEFCNKVSKKHFPNATQYTDIRTVRNLSYVDIISGGFPCQPYSVAGKRKSKADNRYLWPEMLRVIREVRPPYVIGENVAGIISLALDEVLASLEAEGYTCETFVLPACAVGAPHRRDRVWIIAYAVGIGRKEEFKEINEESKAGFSSATTHIGSTSHTNREGKPALSINAEKGQRFSANPYNKRCEKCNLSPLTNGAGRPCRCHIKGGTTANPDQFNRNRSGFGAIHVSQQPAPGVFAMPGFRLTEPPVCGSNDGLPARLVRNRGKQLKAYGNAIVPQVAYELFLAIKQHYIQTYLNDNPK